MAIGFHLHLRCERPNWASVNIFCKKYRFPICSRISHREILEHFGLGSSQLGPPRRLLIPSDKHHHSEHEFRHSSDSGQTGYLLYLLNSRLPMNHPTAHPSLLNPPWRRRSASGNPCFHAPMSAQSFPHNAGVVGQRLRGNLGLLNVTFSIPIIGTCRYLRLSKLNAMISSRPNRRFGIRPLVAENG